MNEPDLDLSINRLGPATIASPMRVTRFTPDDERVIFETNPALRFERERARGMRLDIPAGTAVRFEPGQTRRVSLISFAGARVVHGFRGDVEGPL